MQLLFQNRCHWFALRLYAIFIITLFPAIAREGDYKEALSPKVRQFLLANPDTAKVMESVYDEAFTKRGKVLTLHYFYTECASCPGAAHFFEDDSVVMITVREDQAPLDEYLSIVFEMLNSMGEKRFRELEGKAIAGDISREDYVLETRRNEFLAFRRLKELVRPLKIPEVDAKQSLYYKSFSKYGNDFGLFNDAISKRTVKDDYDKDYDILRKMPPGTVTEPK
jgi:hypothetical protein